MFDDFELNPDDFNDDAQLSLIEEEKLRVIEQIKQYLKLTEDSVKFQEKSEYDTNFRILSRYISAMVDLNVLEAENPNMTDEEIYDKIKEIEASCAEVSHVDLRPVEKDNEEGKTIESINPTNDSSDDSTDW